RQSLGSPPDQSSVPSMAAMAPSPNSPSVGLPSGRESDPLPFIYALGKVEPRFPSEAIEKEYQQARRSVGTSGLTDDQALHEVLRQHRYLARQLCWVHSISGIDAYLLRPRDPADFESLVEAIR